MRSYSYDSVPATVSLVAGLVLFGAAVTTSTSQDAAMDRFLQLQRSGVVKAYERDTVSPTTGLNAGYSIVPLAIDLQQVSLDFAGTLSKDMEGLGAEFFEVIEDNFWDLVLR